MIVEAHAPNARDVKTAMSAFRQSVEAMIPALRRYARALTRDADAADDLVQDTLVRALRSERLFLGRDIEKALATLVEEQRSVLLLVMLEGMSYREVADIQGVPIGTVMSRLARARAHVKASLEGERPALRRVK